MKKTSLILLVGFLLGSFISAMLSPSAIAWYFDPPAQIGISCKAAVEWGIGIYQRVLLYGGVAGVVIAAIFIFTRKSETTPATPNA